MSRLGLVVGLSWVVIFCIQRALGAPVEAEIILNEVSYLDDKKKARNQFVEIVNAGPGPVNLTNWWLRSDQEGVITPLPPWVMPEGAFLVVRTGRGVHDPNFSDGSATFFTGNPMREMFHQDRDGVALYSGAPTVNTIRDFVAWSQTGEYIGAGTYGHAVAAGIWPANAFVDGGGTSKEPEFIRIITAPGDSIGRDRDSTDTNTPENWHPLGGRDSLQPTPGSVNETLFIATPPVLNLALQAKPAAGRKWTFLIYMSADNDLENIGWADLEKLEAVGSNAGVTVAVQADFATRDLNPQADGNQTAARIVIHKQPANEKPGTLSSPKMIIEEPNMGATQTLSDFISWGRQNFPAEHFVLIIWGHGNGWRGTAVDFADSLTLKANNDRLHMDELRNALPADLVFDVIGFQSCLMGAIEVALQVEGRAKYMVASQEVIWGFSGEKGPGTWPFDVYVAQLQQKPKLDAGKLAELMVSQYSARYQDIASHTLSAIDLAKLGDVIKSLDAFSKELLAGMEDWGKLKTVHDDPDDNVQTRLKLKLDGFPRVESFSTISKRGPDYRDIFDLAKKIREDNQIAKAWKGSAPAVEAAIKKAVVKEKHGSTHSSAHGLSIYWPKAHTELEMEALVSADDLPFDRPLGLLNSARELYARDTDPMQPDDHNPPAGPDDHPLPPAAMRFTTETGWDEFVHRYYNPVADASCEGKSKCTIMVGQTVMLSAKGSSDSDGKLTRFIWDLFPDKQEDPFNWDKDVTDPVTDAPLDEKDDDKTLEGINVPFQCTAEMMEGKDEVTFKIRLIVWDNHHEIKDAENGDHSGIARTPPHFQVDDEIVEVTCKKIPTPTPSPSPSPSPSP